MTMPNTNNSSLTQNAYTKKENMIIVIVLAIIATIYSWDIGNTAAITQGTESFYLKISNEMNQQKSYLTPLYLGERHWSKPPLHFLLPLPLYKIFQSSNVTTLTLARLSMSILAIGAFVYFLVWYRKYFAATFQELLRCLLIFSGSICFLKYARIFMMENSLAIFSTISVLMFYDYLHDRTFKKLILLSFVTALSSLIKGPVSIVMCTIAITSYALFLWTVHKRIIVKEIVFWFLLSCIFSSLWYLYSYIIYGREFFDYFFLRENLGKFSSQSYPMRVVFQGLAIYLLPWTFFFLAFFKQLVTFVKNKNETIIFLIIAATSFFVLWLVPAQRSHHYAVPCIPLFLMLTSILYNHEYSSADKKLSIFRTNFLKMFPYLWFVFVTFIWIIIIPHFSYPVVPSEVTTNLNIEDKKIAVFFRRSFFYEESLHTKIDTLNIDDITISQIANYDYLIMSEDVYKKFNTLLLANTSTKIHVKYKWINWRKRLKANEIFTAIKNFQIDDLKNEIFLIEILNSKSQTQTQLNSNE